MARITSPHFLVQPGPLRRMDRQQPVKATPMGVDMTGLEIARHPRVEDPAYRMWIRSLQCCKCGCPAPVEAAHVRYGMGGGLGRKPDDPGRLVPLCSSCHRTAPRAQHKSGERIWWQNTGIDPLLLGSWLWEIYLAGGDRAQALHAIRQCQPIRD